MKPWQTQWKIIQQLTYRNNAKSGTEVSSREARRCYNSHHPLHAAYYFSREHDDEYAKLGLRRGPMAYLAGRAAPLGFATPEVVTATFYNFHPALVALNLPQAWDLTAPPEVLRTRLRIAEACLTRLLGKDAVSSGAMREAAELALCAAEACEPQGRPLYAANAGLPVPDSPCLALWHATTLLREYRGDGHVTALAHAELSGLEALVTHTATGANWRPSFLQATRGWSKEEWAGAVERLQERGLMDPNGALTGRGAELRRSIEADTDRLDLKPYRHLGAAGTARLTELAGGFSKVVLASGGLPLQEIGKR